MGLRIMQGGCRWIVRRSLSTDLKAALQSFYAAVHPKYMGKHHSLAQQINEKSLRLLSSHLESLTDEAYNLIRIQVDEQILDPHELVQNILRRCQLTETNATEKTSNKKSMEVASNQHSWMTKTAAARARSQSDNDLKTEIARLEKVLVQTLGILDTRYHCGCNMGRYCDCLKQLEQLAQSYGPQLGMLCQRIVVFGPYTGISLDGHVMLFTGDPVTAWY
ncbi:T-cell activation inhibitor, mitochondrial [Drosophila tropicalis]|uniref:T-cell activation inhibitor, mitochondrial n=1 Tax=Drosophila tropicalis TaxID=46794 RepID=UPI0035AB9C6E